MEQIEARDLHYLRKRQNTSSTSQLKIVINYSMLYGSATQILRIFNLNLLILKMCNFFFEFGLLSLPSKILLLVLQLKRRWQTL